MNTLAQTKINRFASRCAASCQKLLSQLARVRQTIQTEVRETLQVNDRLLRLALNEAEALAWQTDYPHLLFPSLAQERALAVATWTNHQRRILHREPRLRLAA